MKSTLRLFQKTFLWILSPLTILYQLLFLIDRYRTNPEKLPSCYVISVGNLTVGGTGKTPFVQFLILVLKRNFPDFKLTILSRGYKAKFSKTGALVEKDSPATEVGDEPSMHKQRFNDVQVIIGRDRIKSFEKFNQFHTSNHIVILDDGFQHHKLKRDLDIVLIDATNPLGNGFTIPLGLLREPPRSLDRASAIVYTKLDEKNSEKIYTLEKKELIKSTHLLRFHSRILPSLKLIRGEADKRNEYYLITGVGNPKSVKKSAKELLGDRVTDCKYFPDHYEYQDEEMLGLIRNVKKGTSILTTEKDWVKLKNLPKFMRELEEQDRGVTILEIEFQIQEMSLFEKFICSHVSNYAKENAQV